MNAVDRLRSPSSLRTEQATQTDRHPDYDKLPDVIKLSVTPREFSFMTDTQRANLVCECTEPEVEG